MSDDLRTPTLGIWVFGLICMLVPPVLVGPMWERVALDEALSLELSTRGLFPPVDRIIVASQMLRPLFEILSWGPGLLVVHLLHLGHSNARPPAWRRVLALTSIGAVATAAWFTASHLLFDIPTVDLGDPKLVVTVSLGTRVLDVVINSVCPGLFEEYYYRGKMFSVARQLMGKHQTVWMTALAFAASHQLFQIPTVLLFGVAAGYLRERLGTVTPVVAVHMVWDAFAYADGWELL